MQCIQDLENFGWPSVPSMSPRLPTEPEARNIFRNGRSDESSSMSGSEPAVPDLFPEDVPSSEDEGCHRFADLVLSFSPVSKLFL